MIGAYERRIGPLKTLRRFGWIFPIRRRLCWLFGHTTSEAHLGHIIGTKWDWCVWCSREFNRRTVLDHPFRTELLEGPRLNVSTGRESRSDSETIRERASR